MSAGKVIYEGDGPVIHEATGLLLQPGVNEIADKAHLEAVLADGTAKPHTGKKASKGGD